MLKGEFYLNRYVSCGDLVDVMLKAMKEANKITVNGKEINWPQEELPPDSPIVVYFDDGSFFRVVDASSPLSKNTKTSWGTYNDKSKLD